MLLYSYLHFFIWNNKLHDANEEQAQFDGDVTLEEVPEITAEAGPRNFEVDDVGLKDVVVPVSRRGTRIRGEPY